MNNINSIKFNAITISLLIPSTLWCLISSFNVIANPFLLFLFSFGFTVIFSLICHYLKQNSHFTVAHLIAIVLALMFLYLVSDTLRLQFNETLNNVFYAYGQYMNLPSVITFWKPYNNCDSTLLFIYIEFMLSMMYTFFLNKTKTNLPVILITLILLIPSFVLINTTPFIPALLLVLAVLFSFYITSDIHRYNAKQSGLITLICAGVLLCVFTCVYVAYPFENYERKKWQDDLLESIQTMALINSNGNSDLIKRRIELGNKISNEEDLSKSGPLTQTHELVMQVTSNYQNSQNLYLRGTAYANYDKNKWTLLNNEQLAKYPGNFDVYHMTNTIGEEQRIRIDTKNANDLCYTPYFLTSKKLNFHPFADICLINSDYKKSYSLNYQPYTNILLPNTSDNEEYNKYKAYVYENYLGISNELKYQLIEFGNNYGMNDVLANISNEYVAETIKYIVQNSATYSLNTPAVPQGKDIPTWLLTESDTGYCVHFATTAAMMLRAYGIPSRYVTGYYVTAGLGETDVTTDNAHAWVEYFDDQYGWIPLEATPSSFTPPQFDFKYDSLKNQITTESTQSSTAPTANSTTAPTNDTTKPSSHKSNIKVNLPTILFIIILAGIMLALLRVAIVTILRKKSFQNKDITKRSLSIFRYIMLCHKFLIADIPDDIYTIGTKARFSNRKLSSEEANLLRSYADNCKQAIYEKNNIFLRLFYKLIIII